MGVAKLRQKTQFAVDFVAFGAGSPRAVREATPGRAVRRPMNERPSARLAATLDPFISAATKLTR